MICALIDDGQSISKNSVVPFYVKISTNATFALLLKIAREEYSCRVKIKMFEKLGRWKCSSGRT